MIFMAIAKMVPFLFILLIAIFAFGSAFNAHSNYIEVDYCCAKNEAGEWVCELDNSFAPYIENFF